MHCSYEIGVDYNYNLEEIPIRINPCEFSHADFYKKCLLKNQPCIILKDVTKDWMAVRNWISENETNFQYLREIYGDVKVPVTRISEEMSMDYGGMDCQEMSVGDYLTYWETYKKNGYPQESPCLYLKDWHIVQNSGTNSSQDPPYETPKYFESDWMNEVWEGDDFRFAYMGPKGSWTPFHADVYGSFSWSANIIGQKRWRLYPPGKELLFQKSTNDAIAYDSKNPGIENKDFVEVVQNAGEIIFVPSGWHHVVWNEKDTISINHNWFNASNICHVWHKLKSSLQDVVKEIEDLKSMDGFHEQCQLILKANHGMDYQMFMKLLQKVQHNRQNNHEHDETDEENGFDVRQFDLEMINHLFRDHLMMENDSDLGMEIFKDLKSMM